ncbi:hypothetical protein T492DRAFT_907861 [Pavlovales sp. CCMP2436]|nr:hypothetical protein T492DRAFT_907861 [Pavlovales sp. CCMP2436]
MNASAQLQLSMRRNVEELHEFVAELGSWEKDIAARDSKLRGVEPAPALQPPQSDEEDDEAEALAEAAGNRAAAKVAPAGGGASAESGDAAARAVGERYVDWDRYDAEAEASAVDAESAREARKAAKQRAREAAALAARRVAAEGDAAALRARGNEAFGGARYEEATLLYTEALIQNPRSAAAYANRGLALLKLKKWAEAEEDCSAALLLDRAHAKALLRRAEARTHLRDWEGASADLASVLELEPKHLTARAQLVAVTEAAREARNRRRTAPELKRETASVRTVARDSGNDAFVASVSAVEYTAKGYAAADADAAALGAGAAAGGAGGGDDFASNAVAAAARVAASAAVGSDGLPAPPASTATLERALTTLPLKRQPAKAARYLERLSEAELLRLFAPGLGPDSCAAIVDALASLRPAESAITSTANLLGEGADRSPVASLALCSRLLRALSSMGRLELALAFLDAKQTAALHAAIGQARAAGEDVAALGALASVLG